MAKSIEKAHTLVNSLRAKKPDAAFVGINGDNWSISMIEEHLGGQGLFSNKYIIFLDRVTENAEAKEKLPEFIAAMHESTNIFIVCEGKLNAELKKEFEKHAEKVVISDEPVVASPYSYGRSVTGSKKDFNIFALADAVGSRNALQSWMIYRDAVKNGLESESILGTLFWQAKSMVLASKCALAADAGLKQFVFDKSKKYAKNYSNDELNQLLKNIVTIYHNGHRGLLNPELAVEKMLLEIKGGVVSDRGI